MKGVSLSTAPVRLDVPDSYARKQQRQDVATSLAETKDVWLGQATSQVQRRTPAKTPGIARRTKRMTPRVVLRYVRDSGQ